MSELIKNESHATIRWELLASASAFALAAYISSMGISRAEDADHPLVWIELGGQLARNDNGQEDFLPHFTLTTPRPPFEVTSPADVEKQAPTSWDEDAKLSFQPNGSEWIFSAAFRYGRSGRRDYLDQLTPNIYYNRQWAFQNVTADNSARHIILDFQAGRDFGLGIGSNSRISLGVRFAQFDSKAHVFIESQPQNFNHYGGTYTRFDATFDAKRSFSGVGPSLSWDASAAVLGNAASSQIDVDWGINAALLFGRQKVSGHHKTTGVPYIGHGGLGYPGTIYHHSGTLNRSKQVSVPNLGAFAGLSWRLPNAKVAIGYRADLFFGAMDGGIDASKHANVGFYGPFANVSVGIGG